MIRPRPRRTRQQIRELLDEYEKAGCTVKEFCRIHGINQGNFHKWKSRSKEAPKDKLPGFTKLQVIPSTADRLFAEVNGIRFYQPVSAAYLKELLA